MDDPFRVPSYETLVGTFLLQINARQAYFESPNFVIRKRINTKVNNNINMTDRPETDPLQCLPPDLS